MCDLVPICSRIGYTLTASIDSGDLLSLELAHRIDHRLTTLCANYEM